MTGHSNRRLVAMKRVVFREFLVHIVAEIASGEYFCRFQLVLESIFNVRSFFTAKYESAHLVKGALHLPKRLFYA